MRPSSGSARHPSLFEASDDSDLPPPRSPAAHFASPDTLSAYWRFYWAVADVQLSRWLPTEPSRILDLSGPDSRGASRAAAAGHDVVQLVPATEGSPVLHAELRAPAPRGTPAGRIRAVVGDPTYLTGFASDRFDAVLADNRALSRHLATETLLSEIMRVLRPGGRALLCVDSVVLGMALLAEQTRWPELSYAAGADVLLVPWPDGTITRCFTVDQLSESLADSGLQLEWVKPRTVLSASTVELMMNDKPQALRRLVDMELKAAESDDAVGAHLLASARKPGASPPAPT